MLGHPAFVTVHRKVHVPACIPVTDVLGELGDVITAMPLSKVQVPVPEPGELPLRTVDESQTTWSELALAGGEGVATVIVTSSCVMAQAPLPTFHRKTLGPLDNPVTDVLAALIVAIVPVPDTSCQVPTPEPNGTADREAVEEQTV